MLLYYRSGLPKEGWFQTCIICDTVTSHTMVYKKDIISYTCLPCKNKINLITENKIYYEKCCMWVLHDVCCMEILNSRRTKPPAPPVCRVRQGKVAGCYLN
jgi:hypothetical protein